MTDTFEVKRETVDEFRGLDVLGDDAASPEEYTFVPCDAEGRQRATTWLTADADAVVDLEGWR